MSDPWGISGPAFVGIYLALLCLPLVIGIVLAGVTKRTSHTPTVDDKRTPTVYELAYLAGGADRVVETAVAALVDRGQLRVSSTRRLKATGDRPLDHLERTVTDAASGTVGLSTTAIKLRVRHSDAMRRLVAGLERRGLVVADRRLRTNRRIVMWLYLAVLAVGIARWVNGLLLDRPVGYLTVLLIVAAVATIIAVSRGRRKLTQPPSAAGQRLVTTARHRPTSTGLVLTGAAGAVALGGLAMYPDAELRSFLTPPPTGSGSSGGGSSCSGGSSCGGGGGGGCGGGGCGG